MTKYFFCFYLILISIQINESVYIDRQQKIVSALINHLNIKHYILIKDSSLVVNPNILKHLKGFFKSKIYGSFFTLNQLHDHLNKSSTLQVHDRSYTTTPKTIVFQYQNKYLREMISTVFKEQHELVNSNYIWLNFINISEYPSDIFKKSYVPYNCENLVVKTDFETRFDIVEIFHNHIRNLTLFENYYGSWSENEGLNLSQLEFYQRRIDLKRTNLTFGIAAESELYGWETTLHVGMIEIFSHIMNFHPTLLYNIDNEDQFQYMHHLFTDFSFEFFLGSMAFSSEIDNYYQISVGPFLVRYAYLYLAFNETYIQHGMLTYFKPFSPSLWITIILWILITGICFAIMSYIRRKNQFNINTLLTSFLQPFEILLNQGGEKFQNLQNKIASLTSRMVPLFLIPAYTGTILTFVLIRKIQLPFKDYKGFLNDESYELGSFFNGGWLHQIDGSSVGVVEIYHNLNEQHSYMEDAIEKMCQNYKHVIIAFEDPRITNNNECEILRINGHLFKSWDIIITRESSPYKKIFNRLLKTLHSAGITERFQTQQFKKYKIRNNAKTKTKPVEFEALKPIFMIVGIFYTFSFLVLLLELSFGKNKKN